MSNFCETCRFYRKFELSLVDRLIRDFGAVEGDLKSELTKMAAEEQQMGDAEASRFRLLLREGEVEWRLRPEMSTYCGLDEAKNVYYVAALRNRRGECTDHKPAEAPRTCATCKHRVPGDGPAHDAREIATRIQVGVNAAALGQSGGVAPLSEVTRDVVLKKIFEADRAFHGRWLTFRPSYLPFCKEHSDATGFVPCAVQNPCDACPDWSADAATPSASPADGWALIQSPGQGGKK